MTSLRAASDCQIIWATIAFKFNQEHLDSMKEFAQSLGVDRFQLTKSTKFGSVYPLYGVNDPLQPSKNYISNTHRFEREVTELTEADNRTMIPLTNHLLFDRIKSRNGVTPLCEIGNKGLYIDARGRLFPCCWVANRYNHNSDWQQIANNFSLNTRTLTDVLADPYWTNEFQTFKWQECQTKCKSSVVDRNYATSW
jgi:MoaA/NifB/PqqE/SkfB family radical SAM enzyme